MRCKRKSKGLSVSKGFIGHIGYIGYIEFIGYIRCKVTARARVLVRVISDSWVISVSGTSWNEGFEMLRELPEIYELSLGLTIGYGED